MLHNPKNLPPEPEFSGYLNLLYKVFLWLRVHTAGSDSMSEEKLRILVKEIHLLSDALHNVPTFLREMGDWFTPEIMKEVYIPRYEKQNDKSLLDLSALLEKCIREAAERIPELDAK